MLGGGAVAAMKPGAKGKAPSAAGDQRIVPPGDTLSVDVLNLRRLTIKYCRAGRTGMFERRELMIFGTS